MKHLKTFEKFAMFKDEEMDHVDLIELIESDNVVDVIKARNIYESMTKKQKADFIDFWISSHSTFGIDEESGKKYTERQAIKDIKYALYEQYPEIESDPEI
jgi:hypothetical protein